MPCVRTAGACGMPLRVVCRAPGGGGGAILAASDHILIVEGNHYFPPVAADRPGFESYGHGGASRLAPANTLVSFDTALALGVDAIEFDVRARGGRLVLAHTVLHGRHRACLTLDAALRHLAQPAFGEVLLNADVKHAGCEAGLIEALAYHGLLDRTLVSSQVAAVLDRVRAREPRLRLAISVGGRAARASRRWVGWRRVVLRGLETGRWQAVMAQHALVDHALCRDAASRGGPVYGWTIGTRAELERLRRLGAAGAVSGDPRLFAPGARIV